MICCPELRKSNDDGISTNGLLLNEDERRFYEFVAGFPAVEEDVAVVLKDDATGAAVLDLRAVTWVAMQLEAYAFPRVFPRDGNPIDVHGDSSPCIQNEQLALELAAARGRARPSLGPSRRYVDFLANSAYKGPSPHNLVVGSRRKGPVDTAAKQG